VLEWWRRRGRRRGRHRHGHDHAARRHLHSGLPLLRRSHQQKPCACGCHGAREHRPGHCELGVGSLIRQFSILFFSTAMCTLLARLECKKFLNAILNGIVMSWIQARRLEILGIWVGINCGRWLPLVDHRAVWGMLC
jgi:hypothetical protein